MNAPVSFKPVTQPEDSTFNTADWLILSRHWYPVARSIDVADRPAQALLLDVKVVVYRTAAGLSVALDRCPHRGVPLSKGCVKGDHLVCAYHGLQFDAHGACKRIPAQPSLVPSERFRLHGLPSVERYGLVWTCLNPDGQSAIPPMPTWHDGTHQQVLPPSVDIHGSAGRQVDSARWSCRCRPGAGRGRTAPDPLHRRQHGR